MKPISFPRFLSYVSALTLAVTLSSCQQGEQPPPNNNNQANTQNTDNQPSRDFPPIELPFPDRIRANGAGASFPAPLYQNWFVQLNRDVSQLQFNFQSVGSGAGIEQFTQGTVDFGASDIAMTDAQMEGISRGVLLLPMTAGSIVLAYNLPDVPELKLSRETYTGIFLGEITNWNDPKIAADNPGVELPDQRITVVHRSDGSGTTSIFTNHLSEISENWEKSRGSGTSIDWIAPQSNFLGGRGNEGVTALVSQASGRIGFVEYGFARKNNLAMAILENQAGNFIAPTNESGTYSLSQVKLPDNLRAFITDPPGEESYPIVTYTWMLLYKTYDDPNKAIAMEAMIQYGLNQGQQQAAALGYIELPANVRQRVAEAADQITPDFTIQLAE